MSIKHLQPSAELPSIKYAMVLDQYSRRVLAWRLGATRDAQLTRAVVDAALRRRRPAAGLIFHSDRGSEYLGLPFRQRLAARGVRQSMTRGGAPGENAHMESFFHSLKADGVHGRPFHTVAELRQQIPALAHPRAPLLKRGVDMAVTCQVSYTLPSSPS